MSMPYDYQSRRVQEQPPLIDGRVLKKASNAENVFIGTGMLLLTMLCVIPIWNSAALLHDHNYIFWAGRAFPLWLITLCVSIIALYVVTIVAFFSYSRPSVRTEQTIMMIANIFITMLGLVLMLISLPLSRQSVDSYNNLIYRCDYSEQTHRTYEYSQVLQNIRRLPDCANKFSVEDCEGYEPAPPYTTYLKDMETNFRCSGFCYKPPPLVAPLSRQSVGANASAPAAEAAAPADANATAPAAEAKAAEGAEATAPVAEAKAPAGDKAKAADADATTPAPAAAADATTPAPPAGTLLQQTIPTARRLARHLHGENSVTQREVSLDQQRLFHQEPELYPPTLFSDANYQASCEGMAARDMRNFAGDIAFQTFYQGIYLVLIAIATGFLKLIGFCVKGDADSELPKVQ